MTSDGGAVDASRAPEAPARSPEQASDQPSWWHRDHPTFTALTGFFAGLLFICLVPTVFAGLVGAIAGSGRVEDLLPFVLVMLAVPLVLAILPRTRRFGLYMWVGILSTAVVVLGVGGLVLWYMVSYQS